MVRDVSQGVDCSAGTVHTIIHENLNMKRLCARWIPKILSECQKAQRVESCRRFVQRVEREGEDFLSRIVTADKTWIRIKRTVYNVENSRVSSTQEI